MIGFTEPAEKTQVQKTETITPPASNDTNIAMGEYPNALGSLAELQCNNQCFLSSGN